MYRCDRLGRCCSTLSMSYERRLSSELCKGTNRSRDTLLEVTQDAQLKEQFFTSPIALQQVAPPPRHDPSWGQRRFRQWESDWPESPHKWQRSGKGRGNTKGKGGKGGKGGRDDHKAEGKGAGGAKGKSDHALWSHTPDGRQICFPFNAQGCDGSCGRVHVCRVRGCMQPHPMWQHFQTLAAKGAAGRWQRRQLTFRPHRALPFRWDCTGWGYSFTFTENLRIAAVGFDYA